MNNLIDVILILIGNLGIDSILILLLNPKRVDIKIKQSILGDEKFIENMTISMFNSILKRQTELDRLKDIIIKDVLESETDIEDLTEAFVQQLNRKQDIKQPDGTMVQLSYMDWIIGQFAPMMKSNFDSLITNLENMEKNRIMNEGKEIQMNLSQNPQVLAQMNNPLAQILLSALPKKYAPIVMAIMSKQAQNAQNANVENARSPWE